MLPTNYDATKFTFHFSISPFQYIEFVAFAEIVSLPALLPLNSFFGCVSLLSEADNVDSKFPKKEFPHQLQQQQQHSIYRTQHIHPPKTSFIFEAFETNHLVACYFTKYSSFYTHHTPSHGSFFRQLISTHTHTIIRILHSIHKDAKLAFAVVGNNLLGTRKWRHRTHTQRRRSGKNCKLFLDVLQNFFEIIFCSSTFYHALALYHLSTPLVSARHIILTLTLHFVYAVHTDFIMFSAISVVFFIFSMFRLPSKKEETKTRKKWAKRCHVYLSSVPYILHYRSLSHPLLTPLPLFLLPNFR